MPAASRYRPCATPNKPLQPPHTAVTPLVYATGAPAGGRLNGGVRRLTPKLERSTCSDASIRS